MTEQATIVASKAQINEILDQTAVGFHEQLYIQVGDERLRLLAGSPGGTVVAFTDFVEGEVEEINGETRAIIDVATVQDYLGLASEGTSGLLELTFEGSEGNKLAEQLRISSEGGHQFDVGISLKSSESNLESVPTDLPSLFDDQNRLINAGEDEPVGVHIETYTESLQKIREAVDLREELEFYPIVVEQGQFRLDVGSEQSDYVSAALQGSVKPGDGEGDEVPNVDNLYGTGFPEVVRALDGQVDLFLENGSPLMVRKEMSHGTLRHLIGAAE